MSRDPPVAGRGEPWGGGQGQEQPHQPCKGKNPADGKEDPLDVAAALLLPVLQVDHLPWERVWCRLVCSFGVWHRHVPTLSRVLVGILWPWKAASPALLAMHFLHNL